MAAHTIQLRWLCYRSFVLGPSRSGDSNGDWGPSGFTGCLTLELANLGDVPISIRPGMTIGQLFIHGIDLKSDDPTVDQSGFACKRAPRLGDPQSDAIAQKLANASLSYD